MLELFTEHGHFVFKENRVGSNQRVPQGHVTVFTSHHVQTSHSFLIGALQGCRRNRSSGLGEVGVLGEFDRSLTSDVSHQEIEYYVQTVSVPVGQIKELRG